MQRLHFKLFLIEHKGLHKNLPSTIERDLYRVLPDKPPSPNKPPLFFQKMQRFISHHFTIFFQTFSFFSFLFHLFLDASLHLYKRVCLSVAPSLHPSVGQSITLLSKRMKIDILRQMSARGGHAKYDMQARK